MSIELGLLINNYSYTDSAIALHPDDSYQFQLGEGGSWRFGVTGLESAVDLVLRNAQGTILRASTFTDAAGAITLNDLLPGDYSLQILRGDRDTPYTLNLDPITGSPLESGYVVTKDTEVKVEIAYADKHEREIGFFSLNGMEQFAPDSPAYYQEAARRVLSNSTLGQLLISQSNQPSSVSGSFPWETELNGELDGVQYRTSQTLLMEAGDKFGLMMVPKGTIQEVFDNPNKLNGNNRPVFSLDTNSGGGFQFREREIEEGTLFILEREGGKQDNDGNTKDIVIYVDKDPKEAIAPQPVTPEEPTPEVEAPTPEVEEPTPEVEAPTPVEEAQTPVEEAPTPVEEAPTPEEEAPTPIAVENDPPTPTLPTETPEIDTPTNNNIPPKELALAIETDGLGKPIAIAGSVSDRNGFEDIQRVEFLLQTPGEGWTAIGSVTNFAVNESDNTVANFSYQWTEGLAGGDYKVKAIAYDLAGKSSNVVVENFTVVDETPTEPAPQGPPADKPTLPPQAIDKVPDWIPPMVSIPSGPTLPRELPNSIPADLRFAINPLYTNGETLSFEGGKVVDGDGTSDLNRIEFSLRKLGGEWLYAGEVTEFTPESNGMSRFGFNYDLNELEPGRYELRAVAYDSEGAESNVATENFAVITDPGGNGLSDEVKRDIAGAANLTSYTPEELAKTREWIVWVTPGVSAEELAASVGAVNLGETGQIANTYIWEFAEGPKPKTTPEYIANLLAELDGVEFAYPEVPVPLKLMSTISEDWFKDHWNLWSDINSSASSSVTGAWEIIDPVTNLPIRGRNATIGIVDDGVDYGHSHLLSRYNPNISWDFTDLDADPSPRSQELFEGEVGNPVIDGNRVLLPVPVNLTGLVMDTNFNLEFKGKKPLSLEEATFRLYSPTHTEKDPFDWQSFGGYWWRYPGWEDSRSTQSKKLGIKNGNKSVNLALEDAFEGTYAAGWWYLEISVSIDRPNPTKFLQDITNQIKSWSVELEVANPHGTLVTGVPNASGDKIFGVAPESEFAAIRLIGNIDPVNYSYDSKGYTIADALFDANQSSDRLNRNQEIDVFNNSWGPQYMRQLPLAVAALESGFKFGRDGLGNSYVFSVGNDGAEIGHVNYNNLANSRAVIPVGAISREGILSEYSTQAPFVVAYSDSGTKDGDAIATTAIGFNQGRVSDFGGTSAAAPFVSGVIALMLEVNPNLTSRDVQHILAKTAHKTDPTHPDWQQNGGGYHINEHYGFGAVDPVAAVMAAKDWTTVGEEIKVSGKNKLKNVLNEIKDEQKLTDAIAITEDITVEHAEVLVKIDHDDWKDLTLVLKSPDGTESYLMKSIPDDPYGIGKTYEVHPGSNDWTFTSINHWGESSQGEWKLEVYDAKGNQIEGEWVSWQLNLYGTPPTVNIAATQPNASEDGTPGEFTVTRTGNTKNPLTVNYAIAGSATNGEDYQPLTGTVTIGAGQNSALININPVYDTLFDEEDETVELTLTADDAYTIGTDESGTVEIANYAIPTNHWNARFINRNPENVSDRSTYDFSNPAAILDLGNQSENGKLSLFKDWDIGSPDSAVQNDDFVMEAWTRSTFEAGQLYKITTQSDDGVWFRVKNVETGEWIDDSVVLGEDGADWRDRKTTTPSRTIFFKVPETGEYDFYVDYYEVRDVSVVDFTVEEAQFFQDAVNPSPEWHSTFYWWDRKLGNQPAGDYFANGGDPTNAIGVVNLGSDTRTDGKKGISFNWGDAAALNDVRLPDNNFAIRAYTEENLEAGRHYRAFVRGDDGFQLLAKNKTTNEWVYITPQNQWQQQYGSANFVDFTLPEDGVYEVYADFYEERGGAEFDLSWETVNFTGSTLSTIGANVRSGPGTSFPKVNEYPYGTNLTFDKWAEGDFVDYSAELGTSSSLWYRIAGTNNWIAAAIIDGEPTVLNSVSGSGGSAGFVEVTAEALP